MHTAILFTNYIVPCQRMETLCMGLSCVVLVKMGKILDTYVHKKKQTTKNERCYSLTGKFLNFRNNWGHLLEEKDIFSCLKEDVTQLRLCWTV